MNDPLEREPTCPGHHGITEPEDTRFGELAKRTDAGTPTDRPGNPLRQ